MEKKTILITGATAGFGEAMARMLHSQGHKLILTGRRKERLLQLKEEFSAAQGEPVLTTCFDVRNRKEVVSNLGPVLARHKIDVLVNNAGLALGLSSLDEGDVDDWENMIDTNVKGLLYVSRQIVPQMIENGGGQVINIGSVAGREVYPNGNVYCATKHAVAALTQAMRMEWYQHGVRVSAVNPGAAETEFSVVRFKGDTRRASAVYHGFKPLSAEDIADVVRYIINAPSHVNIADVLVLPAAQGSAGLIKRNG